MKILIALTTMLCLSSAAFSQTALEKAEAYYKAGLTAEKAGNPTRATAAYKAALQLNPNHANARFRAGQVKIQGRIHRSLSSREENRLRHHPRLQYRRRHRQRSRTALGHRHREIL